MKKITKTILMATLCIFVSGLFSEGKIHATEIYNDTQNLRLSENEINILEKEEEQRIIDELTKEYRKNQITRAYDDPVFTLKKIGHKDVFGGYVPALGQPLKGTTFPTAGSGFYWKDSTKSSGSVSLSAGIGGQTVSVSVGYQPGTVTSSGVSGNFIAIKKNQVGKKVKLYVNREYRVTKYAVYQRKKYESEKKNKFYRYQTVATKIGVKFDVREVKGK